MLSLPPETFDDIVSAALDSVPSDLLDLVDNVVVLVEDEPPAGEPTDLLGLYDGVPLTERWDTAGMLPDRILLFRAPLLRWCRDEDELRDEVRITVVHEIAHHFGIEDARLHELGWG